jgi:hypothetical protein
VGKPPPNSILNPTLHDLWRFAEGELAEGVAVDIETAGDFLICIGFARLADEAAICVPFRGQGGVGYWSDGDLPKAVAWCDDLLGTPSIPLVFQNGQAFDVPRLRRMGFRVEGYAFDTMLAQRYAYPELPADLQFIANLYGDLVPWKWLLRGGEEGK